MRWCRALIACALLAATPPTRIDFEDVTAKTGIRFKAQNDATPQKMMIETMGGGVGVLDYDRDGFEDLVFVSGGGKNRLALYRNDGHGGFTDRTAAAGLEGGFDTYGMGVAVADYDNDGFPDLLLTGFPRSVLFHNDGHGIFTEVKLALSGWGTSAGWIDYDRDGLLDLVIANYVSDFSFAEPRFCGDSAPGRRTYCHPDVYHGAGVRLYHNDGAGRFHDVTAQAGLESAEGKCLGLVLADLDGDGWPDIFVANDSVQNFLYFNEHNGKFRETALAAGVGFSEDGQAEAGMGADAAYLDDGLPAIYVTHLDNELNRLYRNAGGRRYRDATLEARLGAARSLSSGFGVKFADFDNGGYLQLLVANGHILDNIALFHPRVSYREKLQLLRTGADGAFRDVSEASGAIFQKELLGRGLAVADFDNDGLLDFAVNQNFGPPIVVRNRTPNAGNWVVLDLEGTGRSNRGAIGAVVTIAAAGRKQKAQVLGASSYCSASTRRLHFGLGSARQVDEITIGWPSGKTETRRNLPVNRITKIEER